MPYDKTSGLPDAVRNNLPAHAVSSSPWRAIVATALISLVAGLVLSRILSQR